MDLYIHGGTVIDGTGETAFKADLGIQDGRIVWVHREMDQPEHFDCPKIDATNFIVAPGFIDAHTHSDFVFFQKPRPDMKLRQGVTSEISGNCGMSAAPATQENEPFWEPYVKESMDAAGPFSSFGEYLDRIQHHGLINHQAVLVGHKALRTIVMGMEARKATDEEISLMCRHLAESLEQGAAGLSSGLFYPPMCFSDREELIALCGVVDRHGKLFTCHMRNYSTHVLEAVEEMLVVAKESGVAVQISHLMTAGRRNWGKSEEILHAIDRIRTEGCDVTFDQYPYRAALPGLLALLPPWMHEGGVVRTIERLKDRDLCDRARDDIANGLPGWENVVEQAGWENLVVMSPKIGEDNNRTIEAIAQERHTDPASVVFSLLLTDPYCNLIAHWVGEEDVIAFMQHPAQMWGSDSAEAGPLSHPRTYGTFPKILREYVFEKRVLTLENAIQKMTSQPAQRFGLKQRGQIVEGWAGDLVIFNSQSIAATSTYEKPDSYPEGISYVILNGKIAVKEGETMPTNYGKVLYTSNRR